MKHFLPYLLLVTALLLAGCSQEGTESFMGKVKGLFGQNEETPDPTPTVVREQRRQEARRQDREWTPENQAKYPIEYSQAQLKQLERHDEQLEAAAHKVLVELFRVRRERGDAAEKAKNLKRFLEDAKSAYRAAEKEGKWPMVVNGFSLSKEKAQERMVEASRQLKRLQASENQPNNHETMLQKKLEHIQSEQKRVVVLKEQVHTLLNDLNTQKVIEGNKGISAALNAINDSIGALSKDLDEPTLDLLVQPDPKRDVATEFEALMKE